MFRPLVHSAAVLGVALALLAASLVFFLSIGSAAPGVTGGGETAGAPATLTPTPDLCGDCAMSLEIVAVNGVPLASPCSSDSGTVANPAKCSMAKGDTFTLHIVASSLPTVGSYGAFQTFLGYGTLLYKPATAASEVHWPDGILPLRFPNNANATGTEGLVAHGDLGAFFDPLPVSTYTGELVELEMNCQVGNPPGTGHAHTLALLPFSDGEEKFGADDPKEFFGGQIGSVYIGGTIATGMLTSAPPPENGTMPLDLNGDGQLDRRQIPKPTPTLDFGNPSFTPTLTFNEGDIIDYPIHALLEVNCGDVPGPTATPLPTVTPPPPVGGIGLDTGVGALTAAAPASSSDTSLRIAGTATFAVVVSALGAAWYAMRRRLRFGE